MLQTQTIELCNKNVRVCEPKEQNKKKNLDTACSPNVCFPLLKALRIKVGLCLEAQVLHGVGELGHRIQRVRLPCRLNLDKGLATIDGPHQPSRQGPSAALPARGMSKSTRYRTLQHASGRFPLPTG